MLYFYQIYDSGMSVLYSVYFDLFVFMINLTFTSRAQMENRPVTSPYFPMDRLKMYMMKALTEAVEKGAAHIRDPIGGSNANLFV